MSQEQSTSENDTFVEIIVFLDSGARVHAEVNHDEVAAAKIIAEAHSNNRIAVLETINEDEENIIGEALCLNMAKVLFFSIRKVKRVPKSNITQVQKPGLVGVDDRPLRRR